MLGNLFCIINMYTTAFFIFFEIIAAFCVTHSRFQCHRRILILSHLMICPYRAPSLRGNVTKGASVLALGYKKTPF